MTEFVRCSFAIVSYDQPFLMDVFPLMRVYELEDEILDTLKYNSNFSDAENAIGCSITVNGEVLEDLDMIDPHMWRDSGAELVIKLKFPSRRH